MTQMLPYSHINHFHYIMEVDITSPLQLRNDLSRIVSFFPFSLNDCIMCDYNNTSGHKMGTRDSAVKNQGCGHLFKVTGLHPSDRDN